MTTRPNTDLSTTGWTLFDGKPVPETPSLFGMVNEDSPSDLDYITSPVLGTGSPIIMGLDASLVAGLYYTNIRVKTSSATGYLRVKLLNATNIVQGTSNWQILLAMKMYHIPRLRHLVIRCEVAHWSYYISREFLLYKYLRLK